MEPVQLWHFCPVVLGRGYSRESKYSVGEFSPADGHHLGIGNPDHASSTSLQHYCDLRAFVSILLPGQDVDYWKSVVIRSLSAHRPGVPALYLFHDYRSQNNGEE